MKTLTYDFSKKVDIKKIKTNKKNPRIIKDEKYKKLVKSIENFPNMLEIRPIVVDENMMVLGGNMRLKACKDAGLTEVPVIVASELTEEQKKEFIIKDNVGFGEWDWEMLANEWEPLELQDWGLDFPDIEIPEVEDIAGDEQKSPVFDVNVQCISEDEQQQVFNMLVEKGYKCNTVNK